MSSMLYITCPCSKREVPTGIFADADTQTSIGRERSRMHCPDCGQEHDWMPADATLRVPADLIEGYSFAPSGRPEWAQIEVARDGRMAGAPKI